MLVLNMLNLFQEVPTPDFAALSEAIKAGDWTLVAASGLMVAVWLVLKTPVGNVVKGTGKAWLAAIAGVVGAVVMSWMANGDLLQAILSGLTTGAAAAGLWSLVGKHASKLVGSK